jgi:hypothetical protein
LFSQSPAAEISSRPAVWQTRPAILDQAQSPPLDARALIWSALALSSLNRDRGNLQPRRRHHLSARGRFTRPSSQPTVLPGVFNLSTVNPIIFSFSSYELS